MKGSEIKVGGRYVAKVSGRLVPVRVTGTRERATMRRTGGDYTRAGYEATTRLAWDCVNETTGRAVVVKSAQRFRGEVVAERTLTTEEKARIGATARADAAAHRAAKDAAMLATALGRVRFNEEASMADADATGAHVEHETAIRLAGCEPEERIGRSAEVVAASKARLVRFARGAIPGTTWNTEESKPALTDHADLVEFLLAAERNGHATKRAVADALWALGADGNGTLQTEREGEIGFEADPTLRLCAGCADTVGGAHGGPDATYTRAGAGEACGAADHDALALRVEAERLVEAAYEEADEERTDAARRRAEDIEELVNAADECLSRGDVAGARGAGSALLHGNVGPGLVRLANVWATALTSAASAVEARTRSATA